MTSKSFRGIPLAMQQDGWWLNDAPPPPPRSGSLRRRRDGLKTAALVALIAVGDLLVWEVAPGVSLALLGMVLLATGLGLAWPRLSMGSRIGIAAGGTLCLLPLVELVQPLSVLIALCGLSATAAALAGLALQDVLRGARRFWWVAPAQSVRDGVAGVQSLGELNPSRTDLRSLVLGWGLPIGATLVFAALFVGANPVLDRALSQLWSWEIPAPNWWRLWFWLALGAAFWPVLVARRMHERLRARRPLRATVKPQGLINAGSVARSLVAFNALFAVQTGMDVVFLYGDAGLPDGISPAAYAHRGAYPLLATALLAGLFAVLARRFLGPRPMVRWLMMVWLAQTMALVVASVWRLDAYVDAYGLTRLRMAAYIWMMLVAAGLGLVLWQIWRDRPARWMILRSGALGAGALYLCAFVSFDARIAEHNLTRDVELDGWYLCELSEAALPAIRRHTHTDPRVWCSHHTYRTPTLFQPADWREWGFRNWRVRRSLAAMTEQTTQNVVP